jgi:hypothetical protein
MSKGNRKCLLIPLSVPRHMVISAKIHFGALSCPDHNFDARTADTFWNGYSVSFLMAQILLN